MLRNTNILATDKYPQFQQTFSSKKHVIFRSYERGTAEIYLTKLIEKEAKDQKVLMYFKHHIYNNVLPYLININCTQQASMLKIQPTWGQVMVKTAFLNIKNEDDLDDRYEEEKRGSKVIGTNTTVKAHNENKNTEIEVDGLQVFISKRMIEGMSLREMILSKDQRLDGQFCLDLVGAILDFMLCGGGINDLFLTSQNIIVEDSGFFHLNYFSLVGLQFSKLDRFILTAQFQEIMPFLTKEFLLQERVEKRCFNVKIQLKFLMLNFFGAFLKKDLFFDPKFIDLEIEVNRKDQKVLKLIDKMEKVLMPGLLTPDDEKKINEFDKRFGVNFLPLLIKALGIAPKNRSQQQQLNPNWQYIMQNLCHHKKQQQQRGNKSAFNGQQKQSEQFEYPIQDNESLFSFHLFQAFDLYSNILEVLEKQNKFKNEKNKQSTILRKKRIQLLSEKKKLIQQQRYCKSLYIPIKSSMKFSQIIKFGGWVDMLNSATSTDQSTLNAVKNIFKILLDIRNQMIELQPLLSVDILKKAMSFNQSQNKEDQHYRSIFNFLKSKKEKHQNKQNNQDRESQEKEEFSGISLQSQDSSKEKNNLKTKFWDIFFWLLTELLMLAKRFYLKTTEHNQWMAKINRHEFSNIVKEIKQFTPPLLKA